MSSLKPCLVCGTKTKGLHFSVVACRACAAFFRRSSKFKQIFRCQNGSRNCDLTKAIGKPICRHCRLKRCKQIGMIMSDNDEDLSPVPTPTTSYMTNEPTTSEEATPPAYQDPTPASTASVFEIKTPLSTIRFEGALFTHDVQPLCDAIKAKLNEAPKPKRLAYGMRLSFIQELLCAYNEFLENFPSPSSDKIEMWEHYPPKDPVLVGQMISFTETYIYKIAEMLGKCEQFAELSFGDKYLLYKHFWSVFMIVERVFAASQIFGLSATDLRIMATSSAAIDLKNPFVPFQDYGEGKMDALKKHFDPLNENMIKHLVIPLKTMKLSQYEFIYLCSICLWTVHDIKGKVSENTIKLAEDMFKQCSNDMHNYYVYEERQTNYASRIAEINRIYMIAQDHVKVRKEVTMMAKVFQLVEEDFADSELLDYGL